MRCVVLDVFLRFLDDEVERCEAGEGSVLWEHRDERLVRMNGGCRGSRRREGEVERKAEASEKGRKTSKEEENAPSSQVAGSSCPVSLLRMSCSRCG
jgi:hypothetical protein